MSDDFTFDPMSAAMEEASRQADRANARSSEGDKYVPPPETITPAEAAASRAQQQARRAKTGLTEEQELSRSDAQVNGTQSVSIKRARDGQTFEQQDPWTKSAFRFEYQDQAEDQWIRQHEAELDKNRKLYGVDEPVMGARPVNTAPTGTPAAPNRTIGAVAPSSASVGASGAAANTVASAGAGSKPNALGIGALGSSPAPTPARTYAPQDTVYVQSGNGMAEWTMPYAEYDAQKRQYPGNYVNSKIVQYKPAGQSQWYWSVDGSAYNDPNTPAPAPTNSSAPPTPTGRAAGAPDAPSALVGGQTAQSGGVAPGYPAPSSTPPTTLTIRNKTTGQTFQVTPDSWTSMQSEAGNANQFEIVPPVAGMSDSSRSINQTVKMSQTARTLPEMSDSSKPIDSIVQMAGQRPEDSDRILQGIGSLLRGDPSGGWTEPYLNDTARLAWASQERAQGRNVDPLDAPQDYIESWKNGFMGSDHSIPLVAELDQQMIDHAVNRAASEGRPFDWREAYGPTGENGLISRQVASNDCGPNNVANVLRSYGYNADPEAVFEYAKSKGYHDGEQFTGPNNMARMLKQETGLDAQALPIDWMSVDQQLDAGKVVGLSSGGHYWTVSARREGPNGTEYYAGPTAEVAGNPAWSTASGFRYGGSPNTMIVTSGQVDPNSPAVQAMGLKPPTLQPNRALLSAGTKERAQQRIQQQMMSEQTGGQPTPGIVGDTPTSRKVYDAAVAEGTAPEYVLAMLDQESSGNPDTPDSGAGAIGALQLMPDTAREVGVDPRDPNQNIIGGVRYFKKMLDRYEGNVELALAAYNAGPGAVDAAGGIPDFGETRAYVSNVLRKAAAIRQRWSGQ